MGDGPEILVPDREPRNPRRGSNRPDDSSDDDEPDGPEPRADLIPNSPGFGHSRYASRKTAAQGMMDFALILANASQLKSVVESGPSNSYYVFLFVMIVLSIVLQVGTGILLLWVGSRESKSKDNEDVNEHTNRLNNISVAMVFLITVVNVFITSFGISDNDSDRLTSVTPTLPSSP